MTIQKLIYFLEVCQSMNFSHAAKRLFISRQALRKSILELESELATPLFYNQHNQLVLTETGERLRQKATPVVQQFQQLCTEMYAGIQVEQPLCLGVSIALMPYFLPTLASVLERFQKQYPGIHLEVIQLANDAVAQRLQNGELQAGLVLDFGAEVPNLSGTHLCSYPSAIMLNREHPYWAQETLLPSHLHGQTLLVPGVGLEMRPLLDACERVGAKPKLEVSSRFHLAAYRVFEEPILALNLLEGEHPDEFSEVRCIPLLEVPPLYATFFCSAGSTHPGVHLLREWLMAEPFAESAIRIPN
jgi:protein-tyrosine phosphatase